MAADGGKQRRLFRNKQGREDRLQRRQERRDRLLTRWEAKRAARRQRLISLRGRLGLKPERAYWGMTLPQREQSDEPPWWRALGEFVFGPPPDTENPDAELKNVVTYIREHQGRITSAEIVALTGRSLEEAGALALQLIVAYEGDVKVSADGIVIYTFDRLATTASAREALLNWIRSRGGSVTVSEFARHEGIPAAAALSRLTALSQQFGGRALHGESSSFHFDVEGSDALGDRPSKGLRNYTYCWEQLERSPVLLGGSFFQRRGIMALNVLNLAVSSGLIVFYANGNDLIGQSWEPLMLGYIPLAYALLVFAIPIVRWFVRWFADEGRLRRNARRVLLLGLFDRLGASDKVTAADLEEALFGGRSLIRPKQMIGEMERLACDYGGDIDVDARAGRYGHTYVFEQLRGELGAVEHDRLSVKPEDLRLGKIIYDSGRD